MTFKGKFGTNFFLIRCGVSELWLSKVLSFLHTGKNSHVHIFYDHETGVTGKLLNSRFDFVT